MRRPVDKGIENRVRRLTAGKETHQQPRRALKVGEVDAADIDAIPEAVKITVACWLFKHLVEHGQDPGTFRHLVYKRLGLGLQAYTPLLNAGGMTVATFFDLIGKREPDHDSVRVPVDPIREMWAAGANAYGKVHRDAGLTPSMHHDAVIGAIWPAMLAASGRDTLPPSE